MEIYNYHPTTGEFLGIGQAAPNPEDPTNPIIPYGATTTPPPVVAGGEAAVWRGEWVVVADYRRLPACRVDDDGYYRGTYQPDLGKELPADVVLITPPDAGVNRPKLAGAEWVDGRTVDEHRAAKAAEIQQTFLQSLTTGVICRVNGAEYVMDAGEEHAVRMKHGVELAQLCGQGTMTITDFSNNDHQDIPVADAMEIARQMGVDYADKRAKKNALRAMIMAASTAEAVAAVVW